MFLEVIGDGEAGLAKTFPGSDFQKIGPPLARLCAISLGGGIITEREKGQRGDGKAIVSM